MKTTGISLIERGSPVPKTTRRGELIVAFIGAGGAFTAPGGRGETNLVLVHQDTRVAVDCGRLWPESIGPSLGFSRADIDAFVISHCHPDHTGGLPTVAEMCRYIDRRKPGLVLPDALEPHLWDETLKGGLAYDASPPLGIDDYFAVTRVAAGGERSCQVNVGGLDLELFRTAHAPDTATGWRDSMVSFGLYVPAFNVFISMDTRFDRELVEGYAARGAEWFFHDATRSGCPVHASIDELRALPDRIRDAMFLMHVPDNLRDDEAAGFADAVRSANIGSPVRRGDAFRFTFVGAL
jgi:ribonuclease BN (tRNA processing enzyme)